MVLFARAPNNLRHSTKVNRVHAPVRGGEMA